MNLSQIYECRNWETEHYNSVLEITVSFLGIHKWEPDINIGFSPALHLQCENISSKLELQADFLANYISFMKKIICGIWKSGLAKSFWNYVLLILLIECRTKQLNFKQEFYNSFLGVTMSCFDIYLLNEFLFHY
jgi:hypothetical protein